MKTAQLCWGVLVLIGLNLGCLCGQGEDATSSNNGDPANGDPAAAQQGQGGEQGVMLPSANAIKVAKEAGLPNNPMDSGFAGPFDGPQGSVVYLSKDGKVTYFVPQTKAVYFQTAADKKFRFGLSPQSGYVTFDDKGNASSSANAPAELQSYPMALPLANLAVAERKKWLAQQQNQAARQPTPAQNKAVSAETYRIMSEISASQHRTTMSIINNMGGGGCTKHYDGVYYLGCW